MPLSLPPRKLIRPNDENAELVYRELSAVIAGHPGARETYTFYEELDDWLGPWGKTGYPIGYGKFYNIAFTRNAKLQANPTTKKWVWKTTITLQEQLRDLVVSRLRAGTLHTLTEPELRRAAFAGHPAAYQRGGLSMVILTAPELLPVIATIPAAEFDPRDEDFPETVKQVFRTLAVVAPEVTGSVLAAAAGPAHNGMLRMAMQRDRRAFMDMQAISRELTSLKREIQAGHVDNIPALDEIIARLDGRQFPDQGFARLAREVIQAATLRKNHLRSYYRNLLQDSPEARQRAERRYPEYLLVR